MKKERPNVGAGQPVVEFKPTLGGTVVFTITMAVICYLGIASMGPNGQIWTPW